jgi:hypothetical protein
MSDIDTHVRVAAILAEMDLSRSIKERSERVVVPEPNWGASVVGSYRSREDSEDLDEIVVLYVRACGDKYIELVDKHGKFFAQVSRRRLVWDEAHHHYRLNGVQLMSAAEAAMWKEWEYMHRQEAFKEFEAYHLTTFCRLV